MAEDGPDTNVPAPTSLGSYRLLRPLGTGGMSSVFQAAHDETGLVVALKVLPRTLAQHSTLLQRFLREAKSAESLQHPNIVAIYDRGFADGRHYLVLEFVDGSDLHDLVQNGGPLDPVDALAIVREAAEGLRYAAAQGITHRDIKPANLLRATDGTVKVTDLGLAIQAEEEDERVTRDGTTVGTVDYMAPEQARDSRATGVRSDIYSLGCTFYYLVTGSPPYPGGDIADKLRRHATTPAPDARQLRAEVPEGIARLIRHMMAKRVERRIQDYDELIAAINKLQGVKATAPQATLTALIDDDDDDAPIPVAPPAPVLTALIDYDDDDDDAPIPVDLDPPALTALIDEDDDDDSPPARPPGGGSRGLRQLDDDGGIPLAEPSSRPPARGAAPKSPGRPSETVRTRPRPAPASVDDMPDLAALAALDDAEPLARPAPAPARPQPRPEPVARPRPVSASEPPTFDLERPSSAEIYVPPPPPVPSGSPVRGWLVGGVLALGLIAALAIGLPMLSGEGEGEGGGDPGLAGPLEGGNEGGTDATTDTKGLAGGPDRKGNVPAPAPWVEPVETAVALPPEPEFPGARAAWLAPGGTAPTSGGTVAEVRRLGGPAGGSNIRKALDDMGAVVELADNGPFFEANWKIPGKSRVVRARPGFRPILVVEPPNNDHLKEQPASIVVESGSLTLEGLDLIVKVGSLTPKQTSLFLCRNGDLTLRDCTVTIVGPNTRPYAAFRVDEPEKGERDSSIRLERTLVRGPTSAMFVLVAPATTIRVDRSVLLGGNGPIVAASGGSKPGEVEARTFELIRSVTASTGPLLDLGTTKGGTDPPFTLRVLGSTGAQIDGGTAPGLIGLREGVGNDLRKALVIEGEKLAVAGWPCWLAVGAKMRVEGATAARQIWPDLGECPEASPPWKLDGPLEYFSAADLKPVATGREAFLARTAAPGPFLYEKTLREFARQTIPAMIPATPPGGKGSLVLESEFDAEAGPLSGDLGQFLLQAVRTGIRLVRIRAKGAGKKEMTPIRLLEGVSLEITVDPPAAGADPLIWVPKAGATGDSLIDIHGGDLVLRGVSLARQGLNGPETLIRVDAGHLVLERCRLASREGIGGSPLIVFRSTTTRDLPARAVPILPAADRPVCRIVDSVISSSGDVMSAELGRGVVALEQTAIAAEGTVFTLRPEKVRRDRFQADLWLDRCTVVTERAVVALSRWPGAEPGPDRPWLVSTKASAFLGVAPKPNTPLKGAMLRVGDPEALARGTLAWQSAGDGYEVPQYAVLGAPAAGQPRADLRRAWAGLWGDEHIVDPIGPPEGGGKSPVRLATDRPRAVDYTTKDLAVEPATIGASPERIATAPSPAPPTRGGTSPR